MSDFSVGGFDYLAYGNQGPAHAKHGSVAPQAMFGWADVEAARGQGASEYQAWQLLDRAKRERAEQQQLGWRGNTPGSENQGSFALAIGPGVEQRLKDEYGDRPEPPGGFRFGNYGAWGFGMQDIDDGVGRLNLDKIKELRDWATEHGVQIGDKVAPHISGLERDRRHDNALQDLRDQADAREAQRAKEQEEFNAALMAKQEEDHAEALRIQAEANEAARLFQEQQAARDRRIQTAGSVGVGSAATIKGSRLSITKSGGRKGPRRFARPDVQHTNVLGMGHLDPRAINTRSPNQGPITL